MVPETPVAAGVEPLAECGETCLRQQEVILVGKRSVVSMDTDVLRRRSGQYLHSPSYADIMAIEAVSCYCYSFTSRPHRYCYCVDRGCTPTVSVDRCIPSLLHSSCTCIEPQLVALKFRRSQNVELSEVLVGFLRRASETRRG